MVRKRTIKRRLDQLDDNESNEATDRPQSAAFVYTVVNSDGEPIRTDLADLSNCREAGE